MDDADHTLKQLYRQAHEQSKQIEDLQVLIDTLQTNLRSAVTLLDPLNKQQIVNVQSYKWCVNWRPGS
jgi:hypothetical protein